MPIDRCVSPKSFAPLYLRESKGPRRLVQIYAAPTPMQFPRPILVQSELGPQINPADLVVVGQSIGSAALKDDAAVDDIGAIGDAERLADIVIGDEDADARVPEVKDDFLNVGDGNWIDARKRLVEQDELRRDDERASDLRPATFAPRQRMGWRL